LDKSAGRYRFAENEIWTVRRDGTRFFIKKPSEPEFEILPEGDFAKGNDDFFSRSADAIHLRLYQRRSARGTPVDVSLGILAASRWHAHRVTSGLPLHVRVIPAT
jgi:hypothetical protein